jgi:hypothetical protein
MKREVLNRVDKDPEIIRVTIPTTSGEEIKLSGVVAGRRFKILVDEYPLQRWIRENAACVLQAVSQTLGFQLIELQIYADTHK